MSGRKLVRYLIIDVLREEARLTKTQATADRGEFVQRIEIALPDVDRILPVVSLEMPRPEQPVPTFAEWIETVRATCDHLDVGDLTLDEIVDVIRAHRDAGE